MSRSYHLVCPEMKISLWVGQGWGGMTCFYSTQEHLGRLHRFLNFTWGKSLVMMDSEHVDTDWPEFEEDEQYKDD